MAYKITGTKCVLFAAPRTVDGDAPAPATKPEQT